MKPRILVIRGGAIGDFILTLPAIKLLREAFPNAHLEILGYEHIISLAEGRFYADSIRSIEYGAMAGFFVPNSELAPDLAEYFASFQQIVSYLFDPDGYFEGNLRRAGAKNILSAYSKIDDSEHASRQLARPLQSMALFLEEHGAELFPTEADLRTAHQRLAPAHPAPIAAIHPGSGSAKKNWPLENWAELGRRLMRGPEPFRILLVGGEADYAQLQFLEQTWRGEPILTIRDLPLPEVAAILRQCRLFLGHDSGISHLAAGVGTPSVLLFGPTDPAVWAPGNPWVHAIEAEDGDLTHISVDDVWREVLRVMESTPGRG